MKKANKKEEQPVKNSGPQRKLRVPQKSNFVIPPAFLNQLNEFSQGGFILITGSENNEPQVYFRFDGSIQAVGLFNFAASYCSHISEQLDCGGQIG